MKSSEKLWGTGRASTGGSAITGYKIEVSPDGSSWSDLVADTQSTATTYAHMGLDPATTRHYQVSAINAVGTSDASGSDDATTATTPTNNAPTVANAILDQTATAGTALNYAFPANTFADTNTGDTLTYTATKSDDSELPSWLSFDAATRTFSGTPTAADVGTVSVKVTASDGSDSVSDTFDIVVSATADTTPPEVESVTVPISGSQVELVFDEDLDETVAGNLNDSVFSLTVAGQAVTIADYDFQEATLFLYVQTGTIKQGQTVVVSYTDPTADDDTVALQDIAGNDVASFTTGMSGVPAVTNNSTNTAATGEPAITGTAQAGQELTAVTTGIMDTDGLTGVDFTYQWLRVDADGTSNEEDISGEIAATYTLTNDDVGKKVKVKVSFRDELSGPEMRTSAAYPSSGTVIAASTTNTPPTAANKTVTTGEDRAYTFTADDFGFMDADAGAALASVKIVTVPVLGTLALDGTAVLADGVVTTAQIDGDMLTFTPARDAHGDPYTTFTFTVNDGTDDSASAYTMTINVTDAPLPVCGVPDIAGAGRRQIWTGTVTVGTFQVIGTVLVNGYGFDAFDVVGSLLPSRAFSIGSNNHTIASIGVRVSGAAVFSLVPSDGTLTTAEEAALRLHFCDESFDFDTTTAHSESLYEWDATLDWSPPVVTRTVYLSLPANTAATGEPAITGTAQAGQELTADASLIMDTDGLTGVDFTYQWIRVDADGTSNEEEISGEIAATYTLTTADVGKKVKVKVSFTDELSGEEERTSAAYPSSGTVTVAANTTAPALLSVTVTSTPRKESDTYGAREHIEFSMTFDAPVTVTGDPTFAFDLGGATTATWYAGSGTTTLRFSHAVSGGSSGDRDTNGISWAENAIALNGGTIAGTDNAVAAILTHVAQSNLADHKVDGRTTAVTAATVTVAVTSTPTSLADTYGFGETIVITVTASEAVEVVGDPEFEFSLTDMGGAANDPLATYDRTRSTATTIVFTYTVQAGDRDNNGIWIGDHSRTFMLDVNDRIRTASQQIDIDRSHPEKGTYTGHKVDGSLGAPTVPPDPTAPTLVSATATTLTIEWTHPGDGGSPLTRNFVHYRVEGTTDWTNWYAGETPVTRAVITNLEAATAYDVRVHSSNAIGNSQWAQSATAFSTLAGTASCAVPTFTGRRKIWTAVLTMGDFTEFPDYSLRGYDSLPDSGDGGGLDPATFTLGVHDYEIDRIALDTTGGANDLNFFAGRGEGRNLWRSSADALRLHVCNTNFDFDDSNYDRSLDSPAISNHLWVETDLDWSGVTTRTVHMSLPLNRPATGAPLITGTATVGQELAVDVTGIEDEDGLHDIEYTYQWVRVDADGTSNEEDITDATADTYTLTDDDLGKKVKIEVSFADDFGSDEQRTSAPTDTVTAASTNNAPVFTPSDVSRSIAENPDVAGQNIGDPVTATDADAGDTLTYTLGGDDAASFDIIPSSGQIRTQTNVSYSILDFEAKSTYKVTVTATDTSNATAVATVTISVTDVDEPPSAPATPAVSAVSGSTTSLTVSWAAPANAGKPAIDSYDVQYRAGTSGTWIDGPENVTTTTTTIASLVADTLYEVQVRATNAEGDSVNAEGNFVWSDPPGSGRTNSSPETAKGVTVSPTALTVTEEDTTGASYTVVLDSQPTATVMSR